MLYCIAIIVGGLIAGIAGYSVGSLARRLDPDGKK